MSMASNVSAGAPKRLVHSLRVQRLEAAFNGGRRANTKLLDVGQRDRRSSPRKVQRQVRAHGDRAKRRRVGLRGSLQRAIEPAIVGSLHSRRSRFHVVLGVEMRTCDIGRARRMNDGQFLLLKERKQGSEAGMQAEEAVQIERRAFPALTRLRNRDGGTDR